MHGEYNSVYKVNNKENHMKVVKRIADIVVSLLALILLSPLLAVVSVISLCKQGKPILIGQRRYGKDAKVIKVLKFRTMRNDAPTVASAEIKAKYITKWGSVLRKTSIDELPQLINVLKGDMSLVGPRPLITQEKEIHECALKEGIYAVRPGITGLAQINGRDECSIEEKTYYDKKYIKKMNVFFDIKILCGTVLPVIMRKDIKQ